MDYHLTTLIIFVGGLILSFVINKIFNSYQEKFKDSETFVIIKNSQKLLILSIVFVICLNRLGVDIKTLTVSIGLTGFAIGLALKDFFSNITSGIMILLYNPFELEDYIIINKIEGKVVNLNLRFVTLENENEFNLIPNSWFLSHSVTIKKT